MRHFFSAGYKLKPEGSELQTLNNGGIRRNCNVNSIWLMNNITYLLGAGASAKVLPIVNQLPQHIDILATHLSNGSLPRLSSLPFHDIKVPKSTLQNDLCTDLRWLSEESNKHSSIDTFAKKLYLKQDWRTLDKLKIALSCYFVLEQSRRPIDIRYDSFIASLLKDDLYKFPNHVKILSWNYDYQFEKAYSQFIDVKDLDECQRRLNVLEKYRNGTCKSDVFSVFKINGTTSLSQHNGFRKYHLSQNLENEVSTELMEEIIRSYAVAKHKRGNHIDLSFA